MKRGRKPMFSNLDKAVDEACRAIIAQGKRPSTRNVRAWFLKRHPAAPNFTDLGPPVREWKARRRGGRAVEAVAQAYLRLDAEQQKAVRDAIGVIPKA